jgi:hypothetical protein
MPKITSALMTNPGRRMALHLNSRKRHAARFALAVRFATRPTMCEYVASRNPGAARQKGNLPVREHSCRMSGKLTACGVPSHLHDGTRPIQQPEKW